MARLVIVDEDDHDLGTATFKEAHEKALRHRSSSVFIFKDESLQELLLTQRSSQVIEPNKLCAIGGHVDAGQTYEESAYKELQEEVFHNLALPNTKLIQIGKVRHDQERNREFCTLYIFIHPGPFSPEPREVQAILPFQPVKTIAADVAKNPGRYTLSFLEQFPYLQEFLSEHGSRHPPAGGSAPE